MLKACLVTVCIAFLNTVFPPKNVALGTVFLGHRGYPACGGCSLFLPCIRETAGDTQHLRDWKRGAIFSEGGGCGKAVFPELGLPLPAGCGGRFSPLGPGVPIRVVVPGPELPLSLRGLSASSRCLASLTGRKSTDHRAPRLPWGRPLCCEKQWSWVACPLSVRGPAGCEGRGFAGASPRAVEAGFHVGPVCV